jgi:hypothetical protein
MKLAKFFLWFWRSWFTRIASGSARSEFIDQFLSCDENGVFLVVAIDIQSMNFRQAEMSAMSIQPDDQINPEAQICFEEFR